MCACAGRVRYGVPGRWGANEVEPKANPHPGGRPLEHTTRTIQSGVPHAAVGSDESDVTSMDEREPLLLVEWPVW